MFIQKRLMQKQFITDKKGNKLAIILSMKEYTKMVEELEELNDIKLYDSAKKQPQDFIAAEDAFTMIEKNRKLKN